MREAIALKRAEAKKAMVSQKATAIHTNGSNGIEYASPSTLGAAAADDEDLGRLSVRETIQRARSSGVFFNDYRPSRRLPSKACRLAQPCLT